MTEREEVLHQILTATQTGTIACRLAEMLNISNYEAFRRFFRSNTYADFRKPGSFTSMLGDPAIVDEYLRETQSISGQSNRRDAEYAEF